MAAEVMTLSREDELWNGSRETLVQRMSFFVGNDFLSDMTFLVGAEQRRVPAHQFILISCSWEFYNALHLLRPDNSELSIPDVSYFSFVAFLRYCYTGSVDFKVGNKFDLLKLAYRFDVKPLIKICEQKIIPMVDGENCMEFVTQNDYLPKESPLKIRILQVIAVNISYLTKNELTTDIFCYLSIESLQDIAELKAVTCEEIIMFDVLMKWSTYACKKAKIPPNAQNLRKTLGEVFNKIHFPAMTSEEFNSIVVKYPDMFTEEEISKRKSIQATGSSESLNVFPNTNRKTKEEKIVLPWPHLDKMTFVPTCERSISDEQEPSHEFQLEFNVKNAKSLLGFAIIAKKDQVVLPVSCYFQKRCYNAGYNYHFDLECESKCTSTVAVSVGEKHKLSYDHTLNDYYVFPILFDKELKLNYEIDRKYRSGLICQFNEKCPKLPNMGACKRDYAREEFDNGLVVYYPSEPRSLIPFLYFAK